ncbi:MAG: DUF3604 domain-containing protein [Pseudomonadales bacterium]|jgi:hypothetical protein
MPWIRVGVMFIVVAWLAGCTEPRTPESGAPPVEGAGPAGDPDVQATAAGKPQNPSPLFETTYESVAISPARNAERVALFGDLHVHTRYSFDAFAFGTLASPSDAYRYAKGEPIRHPAGFTMKLPAPLDFLAVTDHAMFLGAAAQAADTSTAFSSLALAEPLHDLNRPENLTPASIPDRGRRFSSFIPDAVQAMRDGSVPASTFDGIARSAWQDIIEAAEAHNDPGKFSTFVAYEYTSATDERGNLHRNVVFRSGDRVPGVPFSRFHSQNPEGLWAWMDALRSQGVDSIAIPHNSNGSNGAMFMLTDWAGNPIDSEYAGTRIRNEPLVEVTQIKGTSETHPLLSPNDEWADFEIMPYRIATTLHSEENGSYVRQAYLRGLKLEAEIGANPYKFGLIGSSDTHNAAGSFEESNFFSKIGLLDATPALRGSVPLGEEARRRAAESGLQQRLKEVDGQIYRNGAQQTWGASGLAGVWAEENTRDAIFSAFRRKETFATSGPRLRLRLFAGYDYPETLTDRQNWVRLAYAGGVSMGGDLYGRDDDAPVFAVWAARDARSAPLQRLQIIKGAMVGGEMRETVFDVACSDGLAVDPATNRCPDNGARVDLGDCSFPEDFGAGELATTWRDPTFDPDERAFYYVRVLENPTCRWSTWDAVRNGTPPRPDLHPTIQERAWSSPIWYTPQG